MMRKFLSVVLAASLSLSMTVNIFAASFNDVSNHWAEAQIMEAADKGIVSGDADGSFRPNDYITRAEMTTIVNKAFNFTEDGQISFSDVKASDWFYGQIAVAFKAGYITGDASGTMRPKAPIVRQEVAVILSKVLNLDANATSAALFVDANQIAPWAVGAVGAVAKEGIMTGRPGNMVAPTDKITRAETVSMVLRALDFAKGTPAVVKPTATPAPTATATPVDPAKTLTISEATYGPTTGTESIEKDVLVSANSSLKNLVIKGDLTIDAKEVTLDNVTVQGTITITKDSASVTTKSSLDKVVIDAATARLSVPSGATVKNLSVTSKGEGSVITLNSGSKVELFTANAKCTVSGTGTVTEANLKVSNVTMAQTPGSYTSGSQTALKPSTGGGGGGGGGGSVSTPAPTVSPETATAAINALKNSNAITVGTGAVVVNNPAALADALKQLAPGAAVITNVPAYTVAYADAFESVANSNSTLKGILASTNQTAAQAQVLSSATTALVSVVNNTAVAVSDALKAHGTLDSPAALADVSNFFKTSAKTTIDQIPDTSVATSVYDTIKVQGPAAYLENADALNALTTSGKTITAEDVMKILYPTK